MTLTLNCLPEGEVLADLIRRNCAIGFDLRFCRSVAVTPEDRDTITCDPARRSSRRYMPSPIWARPSRSMTSRFPAGADEVATVARALFVAMVNARRDAPDAAQRHEAE
jgi:hypothetical protein